MKTPNPTPYPGGSRSRVNLAGDAIRAGIPTAQDLSVIDTWREAHRGVLNTFQAILRSRRKGTEITVAQRHKRKLTIFDKLARFQKMQLARMDDVAGCRLIFSNVRELNSFRDRFHKARFNHVRRNNPDKYDYIKNPKPTGYRGIHDVYEYDVNSLVGKKLTGLYVEIQYRTLVQHSWSTAVEVIGLITESQPKFQKGDKRYEYAMALASEILARAFEKTTGPYPDMEDPILIQEFKKLDADLALLQMLGGLNAANKQASGKRNAILIFSNTGELEVRSFRDAPEAMRALFDLEKEMPERDIVLVRADTNDEVRLAFRNYFSDAKDFIRYMDQGISKLSRRPSVSSRLRRTTRDASRQLSLLKPDYQDKN